MADAQSTVEVYEPPRAAWVAVDSWAGRTYHRLLVSRRYRHAGGERYEAVWDDDPRFRYGKGSRLRPPCHAVRWDPPPSP